MTRFVTGGAEGTREEMVSPDCRERPWWSHLSDLWSQRDAPCQRWGKLNRKEQGKEIFQVFSSCLLPLPAHPWLLWTQSERAAARSHIVCPWGTEVADKDVDASSGGADYQQLSLILFSFLLLLFGLVVWFAFCPSFCCCWSFCLFAFSIMLKNPQTPPRMKPNINYGLWVDMIYQWPLILTKCLPWWGGAGWQGSKSAWGYCKRGSKVWYICIISASSTSPAISSEPPPERPPLALLPWLLFLCAWCQFKGYFRDAFLTLNTNRFLLLFYSLPLFFLQIFSLVGLLDIS